MSTTCPAPIQLGKPASHSYQPPSTHGSWAVDIVLIHGLHRRSTKAERQLCDYARTTSAQERPVVYNIAVDNLSCSKNASGYPHTSRAASDLLSKVASERERRQRTTARIIFVAEGPGCKILSQALHLANHSSKEKTTDANKAILTSTYGVISLPTPRRLRLPTTLLLTTSQLICHKILSNYETHRTFGSIDSPPTSTLTPLPQLLENPPTSLFVGTTFAYGILATIQYHINSSDRLQRHFVFVGVLIGIYTASPSLANLNQHKHLVLASPLALNIIVAMAVSTCGHWIWRIVFSTRKARLDRMIGEWEKEAREMEKDMGAHVIRFHELD